MKRTKNEERQIQSLLEKIRKKQKQKQSRKSVQNISWKEYRNELKKNAEIMRIDDVKDSMVRNQTKSLSGYVEDRNILKHECEKYRLQNRFKK